MKVIPEVYPSELDSAPSNQLILPQGLIGFGAYRRAELLYLPDHLPFLWMKLRSDRDELHFVVIEPGGIIPGYEPEIFDADAEDLDLRTPAEAMILNVVTLHRRQPVEANVNLIGPIVVNRRTRIGRQLVVANYSRYSASHPLIELPQAPVLTTIAS